MKIHLVFIFLATLIIGTKYIEAGVFWAFSPVRTGHLRQYFDGNNCCDINSKCCCIDSYRIQHQYDAGYKPIKCVYTQNCDLGFKC